jgi:hypothetical protein
MRFGYACIDSAEQSDLLGYIKYEGALVAEGVIDAGSSAEALKGTDDALRYFVSLEMPQLSTFDYPIPVHIERGSRIIGLPENVAQWLATMSSRLDCSGLGAMNCLDSRTKQPRL